LDEIRKEVPALGEVAVVGSAAAGSRDLAALVREATPAEAAAEVGDDAHAVILYSAGAAAGEGRLRGIPHRHGTPVAAFEAYCRGVLGLSADDRVFTVVRMSTAYGLGFGLLFPLLAGAE